MQSLSQSISRFEAVLCNFGLEFDLIRKTLNKVFVFPVQIW